MADIESNSINNTIVFENNLAQNYVNITEELKNKANEIFNNFNNEYDNFKNQYNNAEEIFEEAKANVENKVLDICSNSVNEAKEHEDKAKEWAISSEVLETDENGNDLYSAKYYSKLSEEYKDETFENKNTIENYINQVENYVEQANQYAINAHESEIVCKTNSIICYEYLYAYCSSKIQNPTPTDCYYIKENYTTEYPQYNISVDVYEFKNNRLELFEGELHYIGSTGVLVVGSDLQNFVNNYYKPKFNISNYITDLDTIREGAELGATALQEETDPIYMADKPNIALKSQIPKVYNSTLTIRVNDEILETFSANSSINKLVDIKIPTTAVEVGALPSSTNYVAKVTGTHYKGSKTIGLSLFDQHDNLLNTSVINLDFDKHVVGGKFNLDNQTIDLIFDNGDTESISLLAIFLQLDTKQNKIGDLSTIRSGAKLGATALQEETDPIYIADKPNIALKSEIPDISGKADKSEIPTVPTNVSAFNNDVGYLTEHQDISGKQDVIADLETIRAGAELGAMALQEETDPVYMADKPNIALKSEIPDISGKANKSTTLEGYGITDTYTKTEIDSMLSSNLGNIETLLSEV